MVYNRLIYYHESSLGCGLVLLTSFFGGERYWMAWRTFVFGVQDTYLRGDVGERPEVVYVAQTGLAPLPDIAWSQPTRTRFAIDDTVFTYR